MADNTLNARQQNIIKLTEDLLAAITGGDYSQYTSSIDDDVTCFEPETSGKLLHGRDYHKFYFEHGLFKNYKATDVRVLNPDVQLIGDNAACIAYVCYVEHVDSDGVPHSSTFEETRVWQEKDGAWKNIHFHRSECSTANQEEVDATDSTVDQ